MKLGIRELLFFCAMLGLLAASYFFVFKPASDKRLARQQEAEAKQRDLVNLRQATAGISDLERRIAELEKAIQFFESKLPQEKEIDKILKEVWQMAETNRLETRTIKTMRSERNAGYSEQPIEIGLAGSFEGFYQFLQQLERLSRIVRINQMKLEKMKSEDGSMQAKMTLSIFFESGGSRVAGVN